MGTTNSKMAKWGEGDGRWIVEDRKDGANVNGWHWSEKDVTKQCKEKLGSMLGPVGDGTFEFVSVDKFDGFVNLCNRKGKLKVTYSLDVGLKWKAKKVAEDGVESSAGGTIKMPEIFDDEPEAEVVMGKKNEGDYAPLKKIA